MDERAFKRLIDEYQRGGLSPERRAVLEKWFESLGKNAPAPWSAKDQSLLKGRIMRRLEEDAAHKIRVFRPGQALRYAAAILLLLAASWAVWQYAGPGPIPVPEPRLAVSADAVRKLVLPDGSLVWLKGNSRLTYPPRFDASSRRVTLEGEALFEVVRDTQRPFVIQCSDLTTTVLGTSFNIRAHGDDVEVLVLTGKVALTSPSNPDAVIVMPNEKARYSGKARNIAKVTAEIPVTETETVVAGTAYVMSFEDTRMKEVFRRIEGKFDVRIATESKTVENCVITADFTGQSLDSTLDMLAQALNFDYSRNGTEVRIRGEGCPEPSLD